MSKASNLDFLREFTKGEIPKMEKYIRMFLKNIPDLLDKLDAQLDSGDMSSLRVTVHSMKPQLTFMGAKEASSMAQELESDIESGNNLDNIKERIQSFKDLVNSIITELNEEVSNL